MRYVGDEVALVAAETPEAAQKALKMIRVEYEMLPAVLDPEKSMTGETLIHAVEDLYVPVLAPGYDPAHNQISCFQVDIGM